MAGGRSEGRDDEDGGGSGGAGLVPVDLPVGGGYARPASEGRRVREAGIPSGPGGSTDERGLVEGAVDEVAEPFDEESILDRIDRGLGNRRDAGGDARLRAAIEERLAAEGWVEVGSIEVSVRQGEARLSGTVATRSRRARAAQLAEAVDGVSYVQNDLRARDPYS